MRHACALATATLLIACGSRTVGDAVRPAAPTAREAMGESAPCRTVGATGEPLIVDWKSNDRLDLEVAMKQGVAIVAYDCNSLRLVKGCSVRGDYAFAGVSSKEDVLQLTNADELRANLPFSGASLGGEVQRDSAIDVAFVLVGKRTTPVELAARGDLVGACEGATHFVRAAAIGAFAVGTDTKGHAAAAVEVFGAGVSGSSASERKSLAKDGDVEACKSSHPDDPRPPDQCQSAIRLELVAIVDARPPASASGDDRHTDAPLAAPCPVGTALAFGKCTSSKQQGYLCTPGNEVECAQQCDKGSAESCYNDGLALASTKQPERQRAAFGRACEGGNLPGCRALGQYCKAGLGGPKDIVQAIELFARSCDGGDAPSCWLLANVIAKIDEPRAFELKERGCRLGDGITCLGLADMYFAGTHGAPKDPERALGILQAACDRGQADACGMLGDAYGGPHAVQRDPARAVAAYERGCELGFGDACASLGGLFVRGDGVGKDLVRARALLEKGCVPDMLWVDCPELGHLYERGEGGPTDVVRALEVFGAACDARNDAACVAKGAMLEKLSVPQAKDFYGSTCKRDGDAALCASFKRLGGKLAPAAP